MEKKRNCSQGAISPLFHNVFDISLTSRVQLHINLLNAVVRIIFFLNSENLICRGTDISKCFREPLGIRDNESRLYMVYFTRKLSKKMQIQTRNRRSPSRFALFVTHSDMDSSEDNMTSLPLESVCEICMFIYPIQVREFWFSPVCPCHWLSASSPEEPVDRPRTTG